jgi:hypothetical protein
MRTCRQCQQPVPKRPGSGRPAAYCSEDCRTAWRRDSERAKAQPRGDLRCCNCAGMMWAGSTSLPQGEAMCLPCRRSRVKPKPASTWDRSPRTCQVCGATYDPSAVNQRYCSAICRPHTSGPKTPASQRGYGKEHRIVRDRWKKLVDAGQADCCLCGYWIEPGSAWHLDHTEDRSGYRGAAHAACNTSDGARRGNRERPRDPVTKRFIPGGAA